jgi:DNA-binding NtrC family response regulator
VFLGVDPREQESMQLLQYLRSFDQDSELVVIAPASSIKDMGVQKAKYHIHSFLQSPVDVKEFFGFVGRFRSRKSAAPQAAVQGRRKAPVDPAGVS